MLKHVQISFVFLMLLIFAASCSGKKGGKHGGDMKESKMEMSQDDMIKKGKQVALNRKKGNCLACHVIAGEDQPGNTGPELVNIAERFTKEELRKQIWNSSEKNPRSFMPLFGKHRILTEDEIDVVTEFIHTL